MHEKCVFRYNLQNLHFLFQKVKELNRSGLKIEAGVTPDIIASQETIISIRAYKMNGTFAYTKCIHFKYC